MSLGRLLAAGRSLVGLRDNGGRYRMEKHLSLPKFNSPKNPFASPTGGQPEESGAEGVPQPLPPAEIAAANLKETRKLPVVASARSAMKPLSVSRVSAQMCANVGEWARKLNPLPFRPRPQTSVRPAPARSGNAPVQGELSLDKVRVVRNDLTDADLEVVPAKPAAPRENARPVLQAVPSGAGADRTWSRFATRFFGADPM